MRIELAIHLAMGWPIWDMEIPTARRVFIFQFENTEAQEAYRLKKMLRGLEITNFPDNLSFSDPTIRVDMGKPQDRAKMMEIIQESGAEVIIYDPLTSLHRVNENDNVQIRIILDNLTEINRKTGTTAIVIHHFGKPTENSITAHRTRGASSIKDWADTLLAVTRKKHEHKTLRLLSLSRFATARSLSRCYWNGMNIFCIMSRRKTCCAHLRKSRPFWKLLGGRLKARSH